MQHTCRLSSAGTSSILSEYHFWVLNTIDFSGQENHGCIKRRGSFFSDSFLLVI